MNQDEIKKEIASVKEKLSNLEAELLKSKSKFPETYKTEDGFFTCPYYFTSQAAKIGKLNMGSCYSDNYQIFNTYKTKEEALNNFKYETMTRLLERIFAVFNEGWKPDWNNGRQNKYKLYYDLNVDIKICLGCNTTFKVTKNSLYLKEEFPISEIVRELAKENYTQQDLEWYLKY